MRKTIMKTVIVIGIKRAEDSQ